MANTPNRPKSVAAALSLFFIFTAACAVVLDPTDGRVDVVIDVQPDDADKQFRELAIVLWSVELVPCDGRVERPDYTHMFDLLVPRAHAHVFESSDYVVRSVAVDLTARQRTPWMTLQPVDEVFCTAEILAKAADDDTPGARGLDMVGSTFVARPDDRSVEIAGTKTLVFTHEFERPFDPAREDVELDIVIDAGVVSSLSTSSETPPGDQLAGLLSGAVSVRETRR